MTQTRWRKVGAVLGLIVLFSLLAVQMSSDPCPLHDRPAAHARTSSVSCKGLMCLCFPTALCGPAWSWLAALTPDAGPSAQASTGRVLRLFYLAVFHPPRAPFQA